MLAVYLLVRSTVLSIGAAVALAVALGTPTAAQAEGQVMSFHAADGRGRAFDLAALRGKVVAVTFVSRYTQDEAARVNQALGTRGDVTIISVVDFMGIPGFVHDYARRKMAEADGRVLHICDEQGQLRRQFDAHPDKYVDIFILDRDGALRGRFAGQQQLPGALRLLDDVRAQAAR